MEEKEKNNEEILVETQKKKRKNVNTLEKMVEERDNKEEVVVEFNNEEEDSKKGKALNIFLTILIIILFLVVVVLGVLTIRNYVKKNNVFDTKPNVTLQHTETNNVVEGTYIIDVSQVVENVMPSIVSITSKTLINSGYYGFFFNNKEQYSTGAGSGIIVAQTDNDLLILTNNHVVEGASELSVQFINDKSVDAKIKGSSANKDVAIISIPLKNIDKETLESIKIATIGNSNELKVGQGVIAIGNALGYGQSVTTGVISALNRKVSIDNVTTKMIQIDAAINGGNSGGALLNSAGEVIGINSAKYSSNGYSSSASIEGMGFAIPISDVEDLINKLMSGEEIPEEDKAALGIEGYMITESMSQSYGMPEGFYVSTVFEGSGADKAGLGIGNIIVEFDGEKVTSFETISESLAEKKVGDKVKVKFKYPSGRNYKEKTVDITLSKSSDYKE